MDKKKLISAYARFVPHRMLELLGKNDITQVHLGVQVERKITVLFADIRGFTAFSESLTPQENFNFINSFLSQMEPLISVNNGIVDKYIGDAIMAIFPQDAKDGVRCAQQMQRQLRIYNEGRSRAGYHPIRIGIGLNTGIAMIGTVGGYNRMDCTVISDAVNLASRIESMTKNYRVSCLISENTYNELSESCKKYTRFVDRTRVKGKLQSQSIYEIFSEDPPKLQRQKLSRKRLFEEALAHYHQKQIDQCGVLLRRCLEKDEGDAPARIYLERCAHFEQDGFHEGTFELSHNIQWSDAFSINDEAIDAQHKQLVENCRRLVEFARDANRDTYIAHLHLTRKNTQAHFLYEEHLMTQTNYPFLPHQRTQHQFMLKEFSVLEKEAKSPKTSDTFLVFRTQIILVDWLINHTLKEDKHLGRFLLESREASE
ncbi:MAG: guanylate cyclase [Deltaproteobacteria bacterium]|nr:guanylate cyclase [Deltaproteobacteria bacterium]